MLGQVVIVSSARMLSSDHLLRNSVEGKSSSLLYSYAFFDLSVKIWILTYNIKIELANKCDFLIHLFEILNSKVINLDYRSRVAFFPLTMGNHVFVGERAVVNAALVGSYVYIGKNAIIVCTMIFICQVE